MSHERVTMERGVHGAGSGPLGSLRARLARRIEKLGGRHDERAIYGGEPGDLGLTGGPSSMSWEINGDLASLSVAGVGAVLMEVLHPSVMAGVFTQSSYRTQPLRRSRNDRYARPLSIDEKNRYLREQAVIGRMGGAEGVPETVPELEAFVERMRPQMQVNEQTRSFIDFLLGKAAEVPIGRLARFDSFVSLRSSMSLMPEWAREMTGTNTPALVRSSALHASNLARARLVRWAYPELPCKRLALERAARA